MFDPKQYRDKAAEYSERGRTASGTNEIREFAQLEKSFTTLADNEQWLADNHQKMVQRGDVPAANNSLAKEEHSLAQEEHVLRCLGAALIMQWSSMGELLNTAGSREQIARFLHKHQDGKSDGLDVQGLVSPGLAAGPARTA